MRSSTAALGSSEFSRTLDTKGFWRVGREQLPEQRFTVLALVAYDELLDRGFDRFHQQNDGEGWMLPETLRLADYGLGHDDRAKEHQPVASILGPRFYPWQLEQTVVESWEECEWHAEILSQLVPAPRAGEEEQPDRGVGAVDLFGNLVDTDLFGNVVVQPRRKRR